MFPITLIIRYAHYPIRGYFTISRGSKVFADVLECSLSLYDKSGRGECVPYGRYGETAPSVYEQISAICPLLAKGASHGDILAAMKPGAARNAVDCALWDLRAKMENTSVAGILGIKTKPVATAFTLSLASPDAMYHQAREHAACPLLKIKVGGDEDIARMRAVRAGAPGARLIVDANEGWSKNNLEAHLQAAVACDVALIEQPLPAGEDDYLKHVAHTVPICADESLHTSCDLARLADLYDAVNIKLDKTGGLTEALRLKKQARRHGMKIMIGCMVASSLSMAPALLLAQDADFVDLDGPLLLQHDCEHGLHYDQYRISPPAAQLWG